MTTKMQRLRDLAADLKAAYEAQHIHQRRLELAWQRQAYLRQQIVDAFDNDHAEAVEFLRLLREQAEVGYPTDDLDQLRYERVMRRPSVHPFDPKRKG